MRADLHPDYHPVIFWDVSTDAGFLTRSTITSEQTMQWEDGRTYPVVRVDVTSASHPFWTGARRVVDSAGRVEKFHRRHGRRTR